ncbi:MAG: ROK family protein [Bacteroidales bacterium]|nr:ROK family protein [Bacteroidales bacterium]
MIKTKQSPLSIGADIGGSHISCAAVDMKNHTIIDHTHASIDVDNKADASTIIRSWCNAIQQTLEKAGTAIPAGIGLAMPGPFDYVNGIALFEGVGKFDHLNGVNVAEEMQKQLAFPDPVPVRFMNDATSFGVGAVWLEPELASRNVLALTLGTGFGSAFIIDSLPVITDERVPEMGCVYHLPYRDGIADDTFSTRGMIKAYKERTGKTAGGVKEIAVRAGTDEQAAETFRQFGAGLSEFLAPWVAKAAISEIIIGGNVTRSYDLFRKPFEQGFRDKGLNVSVRISGDTEQMAILGSARLADDDYFTRIQPLLKDM